MIERLQIQRRGVVPLKLARGHFATNHSHINYYVDITFQKTRLSEAKDTAYHLVSQFINDTPVDTIVCLDGSAVLGAFVAEELSRAGFKTINAHQTVYVLEPEYNHNSQIIFRDNFQPMIRGKHVLVLTASITTGTTARKCVEAIEYYGGKVAGISAVYRNVDSIDGHVVRSIYSVADLPDYASYNYKECPYCKAGQKLDALVNSYGISQI